MTVAVLDKASYDVLNSVALKKMATPAAIAAACQMPVAEVNQVLAQLAGRNLVLVAEGSAFPADGTDAALQASAAEQYAPVRRDDEVLGLTERFEETNRQFLSAMSAWQQVDLGGRKVTNDHQDPEYDEKIITRIDRLIERLVPLIDALAGHAPRFASYRSRLERAMDGIAAGQHDLVSSPQQDSVHNIWFEFHEDLLRTLGRERME
jgi:hypothetical protein